MKKLIKEFGINEKYSKIRHYYEREKDNNKVKDNIRHEANYNYMCDLLFLPTTKEKYKYCFVMVDLYTDQFDLYKLRSKTSDEVLKGFIYIINNSKYLSKPVCVQSDSGSEFQGVFHEYLMKNNIIHKRTSPNRHSQQSNVESLNKQLGRLFNGYMNKISLEIEKDYCEWTDIFDKVVKELNDYRIKRRGPLDLKHNPYILDNYELPEEKPKYKIGDLVHYKLDSPYNSLMKKQNTNNFREGDLRFLPFPKSIVKVLIFNQEPRYRYMLNGISNVSFTEKQLFPSRFRSERFIVKDIIGRKREKRIDYYLVWFKGELKKNSIWLKRTELIKDGLKSYIDRYNEENNLL